ncbi:hypothetical protein [Verrucosispora sp. NA02020]|uniref:hypothetical protein n=1 Tax=Verrucosispora sp. NA02020 TaxID=2742132 RepID=UPI003D741311
MTFLARRLRDAVALPTVLVATVLAGCAGPPAPAAEPQPSPASYQLVAELCAQLDPEPLTALDGGTAKVREWPSRPDRQMSKCGLAASRRDPTAMHALSVSTTLTGSPELAQEGIPAQPKAQARGTWHEVPQLGDGAWIWLLPVDEGLELPDSSEPVAGRRATVYVARGNALVMLELMSYAAEVPGEAETEALLVAYAEEALALMIA